MCLDRLLLEAEEERVEKENHERQQAEQVAAGKKHADVPRVYWNVTSPSLHPPDLSLMAGESTMMYFDTEFSFSELMEGADTIFPLGTGIT